MQTDVLIIGGGPAGAATALSLLRYSGLKVTVVENSALDHVRVGENVSPAIFDLLNYLGIHRDDFRPGSFTEGYSNKAAWGGSQLTTRDSLFTSQGGNFQLDREEFDLHLLEQVMLRGGIVFPRTRCLSLRQSEDRKWEAVFQHRDKRSFEIQARYVIDATGRQSKICRLLDIASVKQDQLVAVGAFLQPQDDRSTISQELLLEATEEGWWYTASLPGRKIVASFFTDADRAAELQLTKPEAWLEQIRQTRYARQAVSHTQSLEPLWTRNAFSQLNDFSQRENFLAVGDAAAAFDPLSSMGIGFALSSAIQASRALLESDQGTIGAINGYQQDINRIYNDYQELQQQFYRKEQRWTAAPFWKRRHAPIAEELLV